MKDILKTTGILLIVFLVIAAILGGTVFYLLDPFSEPEIYETNDINDYGNYTGNYDNNTPKEFIDAFFPDVIEESFSDVTYHYKAKEFDTYAYEAYLEFVIEDTEAFYKFLDEHVDISRSAPFRYDGSFMVDTISNILMLSSPSVQPGIYAISRAEIGHILYSLDEHRIIFVALGVYDGGGTDTSELHFFFNRFNIDVLDYQEQGSNNAR